MKWTKARLRNLVDAELEKQGHRAVAVEKIYWLGPWCDPKVLDREDLKKSRRARQFRCAEVHLADFSDRGREIVKFAQIERDGGWSIR